MTRSPNSIGLALLATACAVTALLPTLPAQATPDWVRLVSDAELDAKMTDWPCWTLGCAEHLSPRADVTSIEALDDGEAIRFRLATRNGTVTAAPTPHEYKSTVEFVISGQPFLLHAATRGGFSFWQVQQYDGGGLTDAEGITGYDRSYALTVPPDSQPYAYEVSVAKTAFSESFRVGFSPVIEELYAEVWSLSGSTSTCFCAGEAHDRGPDTGTADDFPFQMPDDASDAGSAGGPQIDVKAWKEVEGEDFALAPSLSVGPGDSIHVSYIVYDGSRGTRAGLYHAVAPANPSGDWKPEFVSAVDLPPDRGSERTTGNTLNTSTALDVDGNGTAHLLYYPHPGSDAPGEIRYATKTGTGWDHENPARLVDGSQLAVSDSHRAVPNLVAQAGRVIAAFQRQQPDGLVLVERTEPGTWRLLHQVTGGSFARLQMDASGSLHLAYFEAKDDQSPNRAVYGPIHYRSERTGWKDVVVADKVEDRTLFWETAETDGSFAFALAGDGTPSFVYETDDEMRRFAQVRDGKIVGEDSPLTPGHGNIQNRMRMVYDRFGHAHIVTGYGDADLHAVRTSSGDWHVGEAPRFGMFALDVTSDGRTVVAHLQPHGGSTLAVSVGRPTGALPLRDTEETEEKGTEYYALPGPSVVVALATLGGAGGLGAGLFGLRRAVETRPRWLWSGLAFVGGFSRLDRDQLLEKKVREDILEAARAEPGQSAAVIRRDLEVRRSTFYYHLRRMEQQQLVRVKRAGGQLYVYDPAQGVAAPPTPAHNEVTDALVHLVREQPGRTANEYARLMNRPPRTVRHLLLRLAREGTLRAVRDNARAIVWQPVSAAA